MFKIQNKVLAHYGQELNTETANYNIHERQYEYWKN